MIITWQMMITVYFYICFATSVVFQCSVAVDQNKTINSIRLEGNLITKFAHAIDQSNDGINRLIGLREVLAKSVPKQYEKTKYLANFVNLLSLSHRLTKDWPIVFSVMTIVYGRFVRLRYVLHILEDLWQSTVTGLVRLQEVYSIDTDDVVSGKVEGTQPGTRLTGSDCFDIGVYYYSLQHYKRAVEWLQAALLLAENTSLPRLQVLEYIYLAYCFSGDQKGYVSAIKTRIEEFPSLFLGAELLENKLTVITKNCKKLSQDVIKTLHEDPEAVHFVKNSYLCQHKGYYPTNKQLRCRLLHYNRPQLRISPYRMEELHLDPPLIIFHDVVYNWEMEALQTTFHYRTNPSIYVYADENNPLKDTSYNIWIENEEPEHPLAIHMSQKSARLTGLDLHRAFPCMLASYGLAGEIKLHYDMGEEDYYDVEENDIIADYLTVMYYLSDVEEGGLTIFPYLNIAVTPTKGNAIAWFNRYPDLSPIKESWHSGCPVLRGSKWILSKFFHVTGQDYPKCFPGKEKSYKYYYL